MRSRAYMEHLEYFDALGNEYWDIHGYHSSLTKMVTWYRNKTPKTQAPELTQVQTNMEPSTNSRDYHVGTSDYSTHKIQPWDIWLEYKLDPWDADIIKRVLRTKEGESRITEYQKIIHICNEKINQLN